VLTATILRDKLIRTKIAQTKQQNQKIASVTKVVESKSVIVTDFM